MLTTSEIQAQLSTLQYSNWAIVLEEGHPEGLALRITAEVEDAYNPGELVLLDILTFLPPIPTAEYFDEWVRWRLSRIAVHEVMEMLQRDGRPVFDPHQEQRDRVGRSRGQKGEPGWRQV